MHLPANHAASPIEWEGPDIAEYRKDPSLLVDATIETSRLKTDGFESQSFKKVAANQVNLDVIEPLRRSDFIGMQEPSSAAIS